MLEITFITKDRQKADALAACLSESSDAETGRTTGVYPHEPGGAQPAWEMVLSIPGRKHDTSMAVDIDKDPGCAVLYTELNGKAAADALTSGLTVRNIDDIQ